MNKLENQIIEYLTENAKYTSAQLSKMTGVSEEEVLSTIEKLEKEGVIVKYSAIINSSNVDDKRVDALIEVKVKPQQLKGFDAFAEELCAFKEVQSLYLVSGGFDLAVLVKANSLNDVAEFISEKLSVVDGVLSVSTHFILKKYKIEGQTTSKENANGERLIVL